MSGNPDSIRLLLLGGTLEARKLAARLSDGDAGAIDLTVSLAGRTRDPKPVVGRIRWGGFGGAAGLAAYLRSHHIDLLVDATHPFAARISAHAHAACAAAGVLRVALHRPAWQRRPDDRWIEVADVDAAAAALPALGRRVFLTIGTGELAAFSRLRDISFLVRSVDEPTAPLPLNPSVWIQGRGPFDVAEEERLLAAHGIDVLVCKNSGGSATRAKLDAARSRGIPVVMIARPEPPPSPSAATIEQVIDWIVDNRPV